MVCVVCVQRCCVELNGLHFLGAAWWLAIVHCVYRATCACPQPAKAAVLSLEELDTKATYVNECCISMRVLA